MATKKQKHEAAMIKRAKWLEDRRESGLKALREDRIRREEQRVEKENREAREKKAKRSNGKPPKGDSA